MSGNKPDADDAVREAHDYVGNIRRRMAPTEAHYKALHARIDRAIEAVRREENEACAKVAQSLDRYYAGTLEDGKVKSLTGAMIAESIRARISKEGE